MQTPKCHGHLRKISSCSSAVQLEAALQCTLPEVCLLPSPARPGPAPLHLSAAERRACTTSTMRLGAVHFAMLLAVRLSSACYPPSLDSLQDQAYRSAVVIEGKVQSVPNNATEPYSVNVKVLDVWPVNSGGLERDQLITIGDFGSEEPCIKVETNEKYIFFMDPTDEPLVFKTSFAPLDTGGKNLKKDVGRILCEDCAAPPKLKKLKNQTLVEGQKLSLKCEAVGNPRPTYKWFKDGREIKKNKEIRIKTGKKNSRLQINKLKVEDAGEYTCEAENALGKDTSKTTINVQAAATTTLSPESGHARRCNESEKSYCVNGGVCYYIDGINKLSCKCPNEFTGDRCQHYVMASFYKHLGFEFMEAEELYQKRVLTITGICVALLVVGIVCVVAYCKTKKQRKKMHSHLRQNLCVDHQNRNLANGPNHPGPLPEDIQMVDYISKNVPAPEHVRQHETETSFSASQPSSTSHHSSTATHTSSHRNGDQTWSIERTESGTSEMHSGMMTSSLETSKCNSPMDPRGRLSAVCGHHDTRHPIFHCRESVDSLRDSPHSDRYVSALTTPARLSPVDLHYSVPSYATGFEMSPHGSAHATSMPAAAVGYTVEDEQPLLRRYHKYQQDNQRHDPYKQRHSYLHDSFGSLPPSPMRMVEDDEYETTQEYIPALDRPKKMANSSRRWRKTKPNGHISHRAECDCDSNSESCCSDTDSDGEKAGEHTPFLSTQNPPAASTETASVFRSSDSRTYSSNRHNMREDTHTRVTRVKSNQDTTV
ncbi:pro-neuregulin-2, membrane-bound isoform-like isoform X2 [Scyliorhinus canicula]|uniref:pro-neuregulin-2, membrane-bound isoform-like isoform X2 n=1 Tax=Scyliorhinus canicula TaxID=7830 RepID=UPI0018F505A6|nr:pro-neuregulin-2, membrane-bound isoform-like isoform X2 [Scyliorhinus canicula]